MTIQRGDILICKSDIRSNGASFRSGDRVKVIAIGNDLCLIECMRTGTVRPLPLTQSHLFEKRV